MVPTPSTLTLQFAGGSARLSNEVDPQELLPVRFAPLASASGWLAFYEQYWTLSLDALEALFTAESDPDKEQR